MYNNEMSSKAKRIWIGAMTGAAALAAGLGIVTYTAWQDSLNAPLLAEIETYYVSTMPEEPVIPETVEPEPGDLWEKDLVPVGSYLEDAPDDVPVEYAETAEECTETSNEYIEEEVYRETDTEEIEETDDYVAEAEQGHDKINRELEGILSQTDGIQELLQHEDIYSYTINNKIEREGIASDDGVLGAILEIPKQQENILQAFVNDGGKFVVADNITLHTARDIPFSANSKLYGFTSSQVDHDTGELVSTVIYLDDTRDAAEYAMAHELGHYIDVKVGRVSESVDWQSIYFAEKDKSGFAEYLRSTPEEFFAQIYSEIVNNYYDIAAKCPSAVSYVEFYAGII